MADELKDYEQQIKNELQKLEKYINKLPKKSKQKNEQITQIKNQFQAVEQIIENYKVEIPSVKRKDASKAAKHNEIISDLEKQKDQLHNQFELKKKQGTELEQLFVERQKRQQDGNIADMSRQELIELVDTTQQKGTELIQGLIKTAEDADKQIDDVNVALDEQIAQLDKMEASVKDMQGVLKRTGRHIQYFAKNMYTDKLIMCLIFCILAAIVALTVLSAIGFGDGSFTVPDQVKQEVNDQINNLNKTVSDQLNKTLNSP